VRPTPTWSGCRRATAVARGEEPFDEVEEIRLVAAGESIREWSGDPIFLRVEPALIYTYVKAL
jgi:hypothetical protein